MSRKLLSGLTALGAAALLSISASGASAADAADFELKTGESLGVLCSEPANPAAIHMCQGFMLGVNSAHDALIEKFYCLPGDGSVTRDNAAASYAAWALSAPEAKGMSALDGFVTWAMATYPCQ